LAFPPLLNAYPKQREELLLQIKDLEKEELKERIIELEVPLLFVCLWRI